MSGRPAFLLLAALALSMPCASAGHVQYDAVPLGGTWEMEYRPESWPSDAVPRVEGCRVESAVPGNWEDMEQAFRDAGIDVSAFRRNPDHVEQSFPMRGWAKDTTLPNPYGCFLYRRAFDCDRTGKSVLAFDCVRNEIRVWINGCFVAFRQGFSTPFELAVPDGILKPGRNEIVLAVANTPNMGYNGRDVTGLTTRALFGATGGIEGRVELRFLKSDIGDIYVTTAADLASFTVHVSGSSPYSYSISDGTNVVSSGTGRGDVTLPTKGLEFWSPENPKRYRLTIETPAGAYTQLFGIRRLAASGERLRLNGRPVYLRGVTEHAYFAKTTHMPRDLAYWRMVTAKRKELGFNFVRFHTFVPPEEYLDATDELGMLVHVESPNFVPLSEYAAIVAFARRHPSVVIYCTGNETQIDEQAELYLQDVAALVHRETDALFSPMSALRGIEYFIREGRDPYVNEPLPHNAERIGRMSAYCDLFTSYQLGVASYSSLNKGSSALLDRWGDVYCGKPRLSHETCIDSSYVDFTTEALYPADSPVLRAGVFSKLRAYLSSRGVLEKSDLYFRNSCEWMRRIRKFAFEKLRAADRVAGFDFLGDINTHWHTFGYSVGMMDEFYRLKPGETVENVRRYNSAAVLLSDLGSDFNVTAGEKKRVKISLSNYEGDAKDATLRVELVGSSCESLAQRRGGAEYGPEVWTWEGARPDVPCGELVELGEFDVEVPNENYVRKYLLRAKFSSKAVVAENEWEIYAFPKVVESPVPGNVRVVDDISRDELVAAMERGERVLLLGAGPFKSLPTTYRIGMAGRCSGNYATVVKAGHPALAGLPHDGYCGWQFRRLMEGGRAVQLEAGVPFDPIVDIASSVKNVIRQSALFEYRVGDGRLLVCSFAFASGDPAAAWLKSRLVDYAASGLFAPEQALTSAQLKALVDAPLLTGEENTNEALNANDPASVVPAKPCGKAGGADRSIEEFGARPDGTACTAAFAKAIESVASAGGGRVVVPQGVWLVGSVHFRSNVEIHLEKGAVLEFTDALEDYLPAVPVSWEGIECLNYSPLVYAFGCTNVALTGHGALMPRMAQWKKWFARPQSHIDATRRLYDWGSTDVPLDKRDLTALPGSNFRPQLIHFNRCKGVRLEDFTVRASPFWTIHLFHSEDCLLRGLDLKAKGHNNDGVDIEMTRNVVVRDCIFEQGDDVIVMKAGRNRDGWRLNRPTEDVLVENCEARSGHSLLVIGSELSAGVRNVLMRNCRVVGTNSMERVLRIKTNRRRGGFVRNVRMENIDVEAPMQAVFALSTDALFQWAAFPDHELRDTEIDGVFMKNVNVRDSVKMLEVSGFKNTPARNIRLDGVKVGKCRFSTVDFGGDILVDGRSPKTSVNGVTLHVVGDSTSAPRRWALNREDAPAEARHSGSWCEVAQDRYALPGVTIRNWARCGWSTKKFVDSGRWTNVLASVNRGDFVFFMLGHNDQKRHKPEVYASEADYRAYLLRFIEEVQSRGAFPVLGTPIVRRRFDASGMVADGLGAYPDVVRELSRTMSIKMVDMNEATRRAVEGVSRDESLSWYRGGVDGSSDMTHPSVKGADVIARLFVERARQEAPELAALFSVGQRRGGEE